MRKRILSAVLCIFVLLTLLPVSALAAEDDPHTSGTCGVEGGNLTWELSDPKYGSYGTLTIRGTGAMQNYDDYLEVPWSSARYNIEKVIIEDGVTSIGTKAFFSCDKLASITIPESVTNISDSTFYGCSALTSITIPDNVTSIGNFAFSGCSALTSITIPDNVTSIGYYAFEASGLTSVTLPSGVTSIGSYVFSNCRQLTSVIISANLTTVGSGIFKGSAVTNITVSEGVTHLTNGGFSNDLFNGCSSVVEISIPSTTLYIESNFNDCSSLERIIVDGNNTVYSSDDSGVLFDKNKTKLIRCPAGKTEYNISETVTTIGSYAFSQCAKLQSLTIPESVTTIEYAAFKGCTGLKSMVIPDSITAISNCAFAGCSELSEISIPESVTMIDSSAFSGCSSLSNIVVPEKISKICSSTFENCSKLISVQLPAAISDLIYTQTPGISYYLGGIDKNAFKGCTSLKEIIFTGTQEQWDQVRIEDGNRELNLLTVTCTGVYIPPVDPDETSKPEESETPVESETPQEPETPVESETPQEPETPVESETPQEPETPVESETPQEPETPVESETPQEPETPVESETPQEPETPVESETPTQPDINVYTITFRVQDGVSADITRTTNKDGIVAEWPADPVRAGYTFTGWYRAAGGGARVTSETPFTRNTIIYAHWYTGENPPADDHYRISITGGTASPSSAAAGTTVTLTATLKENQLFKSWEIYPNVDFMDGSSKNANPASFIMPERHVSVAANVRTILKQPPQLSGNARVTMEEGITEVPEAIKARYATEGEVCDALMDRLPQNANAAIYDVALVSIDGGAAGNFPADGKLTVTLPYPEGTGSATHDFTVAHMFTTADFGKTPGDIETPEAVNTDDGICFTVTGLSPIALGWTQRDSSEGGSSNPGSSSGTVINPPATTPTYSVIVSGTRNGSISVSPQNAEKGDTVQIAVNPDSGYQLDELRVLGQDGSEIRFTPQGSGLYAFTMPRGSVTVDASFMTARTTVKRPTSSGSASTVKRPASKAETVSAPSTTDTQAPQFQPQAAAPANALPFTDIPSAFYNAVRYVSEKGIMTGTSATQFAPDVAISRAMIVSILYRLEGSPAASAANFPDVAAGQWYAAAVAWASANRIVSGYSNGTFAPEDTITHEQLISILYRYARFKNYSVSAAADLSGYPGAASIQPYALDAMKWAAGRQLIASDGVSALAPGAGITRAQAADVLMRFCENASK